jgi:hypothetical protein
VRPLPKRIFSSLSSSSTEAESDQQVRSPVRIEVRGAPDAGAARGFPQPGSLEEARAPVLEEKHRRRKSVPDHQIEIAVAIEIRRNYTRRSRSVSGDQTRRPELQRKRRGANPPE